MDDTEEAEKQNLKSLKQRFVKENKKRSCFEWFKESAIYKWLSAKIDFKETGYLFYDIITMIISVSDVTTDVLILYQFYKNQYFTFFYISIVILAIAQMAYVIAFILRFICWKDGN